MKIDVLAATMNQKNPARLASVMGVQGGIVINQVTEKHMNLPEDIPVGILKVFSMRDKGLSRSRNASLRRSEADICMLADDDVRFIKDYQEIIKDGYRNYPDADIIVFYVEDENKKLDRTKTALRRGRLGLVGSMKVRSVQISFRKKSVTNTGIEFNEKFGAGTELYMGEDNIFLADCIRRGLRVYSYPEKIASLVDEGSSWFKGFDKDYLRVKGVVFRAMSPLAWPLFILQFAIRKKGLFNMGRPRMLAIMLRSALRTSEQ